jgi:hypothetical protein
MARNTNAVQPRPLTWSFVYGEVLEFPIELSFIDDASAYTVDVVVVEGENIEGQKDAPKAVRPLGDVAHPTVRKPKPATVWNSDPLNQAYEVRDVVDYYGVHYELQVEGPYSSALAPNTDSNWLRINMNIVTVEFDSTFGDNWLVKPTLTSNVYGFFEVQVQEPVSPVFRRTWKPVKGVIELSFSPNP